MPGRVGLTILQINDTHGYPELHPELLWEPDGRPHHATLGGYARLATLFRRAREDRPDGVVALDNGDTLHGTFAVMASRPSAFSGATSTSEAAAIMM